MNLRRLSPGSAGAYAAGTGMVLIASLVRWGLGLLTDEVQAFTTFYPAVLFAALIGGASVGVFTALLSGLISWWVFLSTNTSFSHPARTDEINLLTFVIASLLIVWAADHYRSLTKRLEDEERFRTLAVEELAHRLKNKLATIQAIIGFRLREHPDIKDRIIHSLNALSATDDLIMASQGQGADLRDILSAELAPYDVSRISLEGPNVLLPPKQALMMALLVHELATNAAKYGSFSNSNGRLSINWSYSDPRLNIDWRESDGPLVTPPTRRGFGTRLFLRALEQFGGKVEANFASTGLVCKLTIVLADGNPKIVPGLSSEKPKIFAAG